MALAGPLSSQVFFPASLLSGKYPQSRPPSKGNPAGTPAETKVTSQESHRQMFRLSVIRPEETPLQTLSRLSDAAHQWLRPQEHTKEQIVEMIILEQFLSLLPVEMQVALRARGPGSSSQEIAQEVEAALQPRKPADVVAELPVNFEEPSASFAKSERASMNPKQKTLHWKVMKEIDETGSSKMVVHLSNSDTSQTKATHPEKSETEIPASTQPKSIHPVSTCTIPNSDIIMVKIESESEFWQDDPKEEGNEIPSWHFNKEEDNLSHYWPQQMKLQGSHPWNVEENSFHFGSSLEESDKPQIHLNTEQEVVDPTSAWPGKRYTSASGYVTPGERHTSKESSFMWPECKQCLPLSSDSVGHSGFQFSEGLYSCVNSENAFSNSSVLFKRVASTAKERCYLCKDCGESFACKSTLNHHEMTHTGDRPHKCYGCGKSFRARSTLVNHQRIHTGEKPHQCSHCNKSFRVKSALTIHQRLHTGEKPFLCPDCGKRFNQRMKLVYHYRIHTGERPYQCFDCGKGFIKRSGLVQHNERVHS